MGSGMVLAILAVLALASMLAFMTLGARGSWAFVLSFRGTKLAALLLVAYAIAISTVLFQTITNNRILTPSIMGFDSLYALLQTVLVFTLGAGVVSAIEPRIMFLIEVTTMVCFSLVLYRFLFSGAVRSLHLLMLVGIIFGVLFRSLAGFLQRIVDPNDFMVLQDRLFASFNSIDSTLLGISALLIGLVSIVAWRIFHTFDVMGLGRETAISLGVDHRRITMTILVLVTVLVSVSTALVGPVTFFGLLVANLAYLVMPSGKHRYVLPAAMLIAIICLVGGQTILERLFAFDTALSIVIEFAGGLFFIVFLLRGSAR
jgi:iron complex transport system permease protein